MRLTHLFVAFFATATFAEDITPNDFLVQLDSKVQDRSLSHYANTWWQWAYSMPQSESPVRDVTGEKCAVNQDGDVWFLAGGFGNSKISRRCTIPADTYLFFPIINMVQFTAPDVVRTCQEVKDGAARNNDRFVQLRATLNGALFSGLDQYRIASEECFDLLAKVPPENQPPSYAPAATDGYWMMLKPLPAGEHDLHFQAFYTNQDTAFGTMVQNIGYRLTVLDE